ncbi:hypothetical protein [Arthrobacter psychrochitiniphilus]|uniref:Uncharacterized protein n=1 Tax=Arthrobacter psychrochitiniphilus TaxID=291045 RepID=A0A2V3DQ78_9MICC|nr:hypothetical protein [Arthrobacter psychrochitiniphilus]NYG17843.1 hypothetical protein [Arthrobacter psychrochitiniphilus]PXA65120.1 hypothetical protein CVS29_10530 [Arthrobacter psychrochitiniphilus]
MTTEFWTIVSAVSAIIAALGAIIVPIIIYKLSKRPTEPWELKRLEDTLWQLKYLGKSPVWVTYFLNFHGGPVTIMNGAGAPVMPWTHGRTEILRLGTQITGTELTVFYRDVKPTEAELTMAPEYGTPDGMNSPLWSQSVW